MRSLRTSIKKETGRTLGRVMLFSIVLLLLTISLGGCGALKGSDGIAFTKVDNVQIGMVESNGLNSAEARFHTLSGRKTWRERLEAGDTLSLDYEAEVEKGTLALQVEDSKDAVIWEKVVAAGEKATDEVEMVVEESGTYTIVVAGDDAGGRYQLAWDQIE